jgi:phosphoribosyl-ATP pyrophosphohydrolase/phosphoribosyl-AMP cyclohydrolase
MNLPKNATTRISLDADLVAWEKGSGLIPAIVQDATDGRVLMLAWMNRDAMQQTLDTRRVTFFSRSRGRLWVKGETSGNTLELVDIDLDCDGDSLLVLARPAGPVCHRGTPTCFSEQVQPTMLFLSKLQALVDQRRTADPRSSYTARLLHDDLHRVAQKVGEEAIETILAATSRDADALINESADLIYHLMVLLAHQDVELNEVIQCLVDRDADRSD